MKLRPGNVVVARVTSDEPRCSEKWVVPADRATSRMTKASPEKSKKAPGEIPVVPGARQGSTDSGIAPVRTKK